MNRNLLIVGTNQYAMVVKDIARECNRRNKRG